MKRVFIVHGWDGNPEEGWFPWLKKELEGKGFEVFVPALPDAAWPRIEKWVPALAQTVGVADQDTYFVGHSMGCQTIVRYLESLPEGQQVGGAVFVAGFLKHISNLEDDERVRETAKYWLEAPLDLGKVRSHLPKCAAVFSDNDQYVPLDNQDDFRDKLGAEILMEHSKGHFSGSDEITELPIVLQKLLEFSK